MKKVSIVFNKKKINFGVYDALISLLIITSLAFYDVKPVFLGLQAISIAVLVLQLINAHVKKYFWSYGIWFVLLCSYSFLSIFWSERQNVTALSSTLSVVQVGLIGLCILMYASTEESLRRCINAFVVSAVMLSVRFFISVPISYWGQESRFSKDTIFGSNRPALVMSYAAVILVWMLMTQKEQVKKKKILFGGLIVLFLFVSLLMGTKQSLLIFGIGVMVLMLGSAKNPGKLLLRIGATAILFVVAYIAIMNVPVLYGAIGYRLEGFLAASMAAGGDKSTISRQYFIQDAFKVFLEHPILGIGQDGYRYVNSYQFTYSHNNYVEMLANLGTIGAMLYYWMPFRILGQAVRRRSVALIVTTVMTAILVNDLAMISYSNEIVYILFAICIALMNVSDVQMRQKN